MMLPDPAAHGMTFNGQPFDIEPLPRIIDGDVWTELAAGVEQRARALDRFLADVYGASSPEDAEIVRAGRMDAAVIRRAPGYTGLGHRVPGELSGPGSPVLTWCAPVPGTTSPTGGCWRTTSACPPV